MKAGGTVALLAFFAVVLMVVEKAQMLVAVEVGLTEYKKAAETV